MTPASCTMCTFYTPDLKDPRNAGTCRRHTPNAYPVGGNNALTVWPTVLPHDWCAEGEQGVSHDSRLAGQALMENDKKNGRHH
jgi:hypothetical protein